VSAVNRKFVAACESIRSIRPQICIIISTSPLECLCCDFDAMVDIREILDMARRLAYNKVGSFHPDQSDG
jgi:hypothetical protein